MKILDVGCGGAKREGAIGIDARSHFGVDIVCNLDHFPWPFKDNRFDLVLCKDIIEHLEDIVKIMEEIHRISKPSGRIIIETPHFAHPNSFRDPTHKWHFTYGTFDYFTGDILYPRYSNLKFKMIKKEFRFRKKYSIGKILSTFSARRYEKYYAHRYPPHGLYFELQVIK